MKFEAKLKHLHISPRKVRLVADMIRGKDAVTAQTLLGFAVKKGAEPVLKLLNSALANAKSVSNIPASDLYVRFVTVDEGPVGRRILPRAKGRGDVLRKRTAHVNLVLESRGEAKAKKPKAKKDIKKSIKK